jgi:hypothetical protein
MHFIYLNEPESNFEYKQIIPLFLSVYNKITTLVFDIY